MNIGFTGTRENPTPQQLETLRKILTEMAPFSCHHGDCRGADAAFHEIAADLQDASAPDVKPRLVIHAPSDEKDRAFSSRGHKIMIPPKTYLARNRDIVDQTDILIAVPRTVEEEQRSGTWYTVRYARKKHKKIIIINPDGTQGKNF
jgi:hypothetical protein